MLKYLEMPASLVWHIRSYEDYMNNDPDGLNRKLDRFVDIMSGTLIDHYNDSIIYFDEFRHPSSSSEKDSEFSVLFDEAYRLAVSIKNQNEPETFLRFKMMHPFYFHTIFGRDRTVLPECMAIIILSSQKFNDVYVEKFIDTWKLRILENIADEEKKMFVTSTMKSFIEEVRHTLDSDLTPQPMDFSKLGINITGTGWLTNNLPIEDLPELLSMFKSIKDQEVFLNAWHNYVSNKDKNES